MSTRVQVVLSEEEREAFAYEARRKAKSLSAWLRDLGKGAIERSTPKPGSLRQFFKKCADQQGPGSEPDWEVHLQTLSKAKRP